MVMYIVRNKCICIIISNKLFEPNAAVHFAVAEIDISIDKLKTQFSNYTNWHYKLFNL